MPFLPCSAGVRILRPRLVPAVLMFTLAALVSSVQAQTTVSPIRKWTLTENRSSIFLDRTYSGGTTGGTTYSDYAGAQTVTLSEMVGAARVTSTFDAYCLDAAALLYRPSYNVNIDSTNNFPIGRPGIQHGGAAAWLYNNFAASAFSDNRQSAALQLSIWEVIEDWDGTQGSINLGGGNLRYLGSTDGAAPTADITSRANAMLTAWSGKQDTATWLDGQSGGTDGNGRPIVDPQDLIGPKRNAVPEPSALALVALPLLGLLARRRR